MRLVLWAWLLPLTAWLSCGNQPLLLVTLPTFSPDKQLRVAVILPDGTQRNDLVGAGSIPSSPPTLAIYLPADADGMVQIQITVLGSSGCQESQAQLTTLVPSGLRRVTKLPTAFNTFTLITPNLCPLTVQVTGRGSVASSVGGINCSASGGTCRAYLESQDVQLLATPQTGFYANWGNCPISNSGQQTSKCTLLTSGPQTITVSFMPLGCSASGWCSAPALTPTITLRAVTAFQNSEALVAGERGTVLRCMGAGCAIIQAGNQDFFAAGTINSTNIFLAGPRVFRCQAGTGLPSDVPRCESIGTPIAQLLNAIWASDIDDVYLVGNAGAMARCNAKGCSSMTSGTTQNLVAVWGSDAANVYAVGIMGTIVRCALGSSSCTVLTSGTTQNLNTVWGSDAANVYAAGGTGTIVRCAAGSSTCSVLATGPNVTLNAAAASDANNVYIAGNNGTIIRCQAGMAICTTVATNDTNDLVAAWATAGIAYFGGVGGSLLSCAAGAPNCSTVTSGTTSRLRAIWGSDANHVYAVGDNGTVIYKGP